MNSGGEVFVLAFFSVLSALPLLYLCKVAPRAGATDTETDFVGSFFIIFAVIFVPQLIVSLAFEDGIVEAASVCLSAAADSSDSPFRCLVEKSRLAALLVA